MFKNKLFKISLASIVISGSIVAGLGSIFSLVSCGHKSNPPIADWNSFYKQAINESTINIINNANPLTTKGWKDDYEPADFTADKPIVVKQTISIVIHAVLLKQFATFQIRASSDFIYNVKSWECIKQPQYNDKAVWDFFKISATAESAPKLLVQAKTSQSWNSFKWDGDASINVWQKSDQAEFDVYGGLGQHNDPLNLMRGFPSFDEINHTVSAIISIKDKNGTYDANPIKATIKFDTLINKKYSIEDWTFSQATQYQSWEKNQAIFNSQVTIAKNDIKKFQSHTWDNQDHSEDAQAFLKTIGLPGITRILTFKSSEVNFQIDSSGITSVIVLNVKDQFNHMLAEFDVKYTFKFRDPSKSTTTGSAFNYIFDTHNSVHPTHKQHFKI